MKIDHLAVSGISRDAAGTHIQDALDVPLQIGGQHTYFGTHNHLLGLEDGLYLEAIAPDPDAPLPTHPRWFGLDAPPAPPCLSHWICRVDDLEAVVAALPLAGEIIALERGPYRWRMAQPASGQVAFDGMFPALIQWDTGDVAPSLVQQGVALQTLHVQHPDAPMLAAQLTPFLNDARVRFAEGRAKLTAMLQTPAGTRVLT